MQKLWNKLESQIGQEVNALFIIIEKDDIWTLIIYYQSLLIKSQGNYTKTENNPHYQFECECQTLKVWIIYCTSVGQNVYKKFSVVKENGKNKKKLFQIM